MSTSTNAAQRSKFWSSLGLIVIGIAVGIVATTFWNRPAGQQAQAQAEPVKAAAKWEYKVVDVETVKEEEGDIIQNYGRKLTDESKNGWELFSWNYPLAIYRRAK